MNQNSSINLQFFLFNRQIGFLHFRLQMIKENSECNMKQVIFLNLDGFFSYSNYPYSMAIIAVFSGTCLFVSIQKKKKHWAGMLFSRLGKPAFHSFILLAILQKVGEEFKIHGTLSLVLTEAGS